MKVAVILFNLGGPTSKDAIPPFLYNFFMDKNIIGAPLPIRFLLAKLISWRRSKKEAGESYDMLGGKSPLLENTIAQNKALQKQLDAWCKTKKIDKKSVKIKSFVSMRYWHPMADEVVQKVKKYNPDRIIILPLYPQFSTTTTGSSVEDWQRTCKKFDLKKPTSIICCYPFQDEFIKASADNIMKEYNDFTKNTGVKKKPRLLFSAHGLPENIIKKGDPYQFQCEETARLTANYLKEKHGLKNLDWEICYQSKVGPLKWIGPSLDEALEKAKDDAMPVLVYPHAFVSEHVETLVELDIEYREMAEHLGIKGYACVPTVSTNPTFIKGLARAVKERLVRDEKSNLCGKIDPDTGRRICGVGFSKCPSKLYCDK